MPDQRLKPLLVTFGPTASGKSAAAIQVCRAIGGEIISADSMQVYRGFDIGTAKHRDEDSGVPQHLIDICAPDGVFSAADFVRRTLELVPEIEGRGCLPVVVGGTGLYLRALLDGIFEGPPRDSSIRARLREEAQSHGLSRLYLRLGEIDPDYQSRIHSNDRVRIIRALEVAEITGTPLSAHFERNSLRLEGHDVLKLGLLLPREDLYARIDRRVEWMMEAGLVEEVSCLLAQGVSRQATPFKALGYRQVLDCLDGSASRAETIASIQQETRRFAKRQMTWFRREQDAVWVRADRIELILPLVRHRLLY
ncbi:MAG: tRNA (adenosine(37)-N6)-dimethylallyltransferase MiaA [Acidobacteriota bacterium]